jgi:hypothetical protein
MAVVEVAVLDLGLLAFLAAPVVVAQVAATIELVPQQQQIPEAVVVAVEYLISLTAELADLV